MISMKQLRYFDALARHQHFGRAAESCAISQPALSMQIRDLEVELGVPLVERATAAISLTEEGREVARRAAAILMAVTDLSDFARHRRNVLGGPLRLGIIPSIAPYLLPVALPALQASFPELDLQVRETQTSMLVSELATGDLDVIIAALPVATRDLDAMALFDDAFVVAVPQADAPGWTGIDVCARLAEERVLLLEEGHCLRDQALQFCNLPADSARRTLGATSLSTIIQMVAAGFGVTLLPRLCADIEVRDERIALIEFGETTPHRTVGLLWRKSSPRKRDFIALGDAILGSQGRPALRDEAVASI